MITNFTVAIPTFRRPGELRRCLAEVLPMVDDVNNTEAARLRGSVLVIDNDPDTSGATEARRPGRGRVRYVVETRPGIASVRNRAISETQDSDLLIFIDDDEHPLEGWLPTLLETWGSTGATVVGGRVVSEFETELSPWVAAGDFFLRRRLPTGTVVPTAAAGNLLVDLHQARKLGVTFDPTLGLRGGEDTLFTLSITRAGGTVVWCNESQVVDRVPAARCTARWVLARAFHHGGNDTVVRLRLCRGRVDALRLRAVAIARGIARIVYGLGRAAYGVLTRSLRHQARGLRASCRGAGMACAALGLSREEYSRR